MTKNENSSPVLLCQEEEEDQDWYFEGDLEKNPENYICIEADALNFTPTGWKNLLGRYAEWTAPLNDWQAEALANIANEDGWGFRIEWGVFMCPCHLRDGHTLVVNTEGVW